MEKHKLMRNSVFGKDLKFLENAHCDCIHILNKKHQRSVNPYQPVLQTCIMSVMVKMKNV